MRLKGGYTTGELAIAVRREKQELLAERIAAVRQLKTIDNRLKELNQAEHLLEGGF